MELTHLISLLIMHYYDFGNDYWVFLLVFGELSISTSISIIKPRSMPYPKLM